MSSDLREQLLKAGLVSKEQFEGANSKPKRRPTKGAGAKPNNNAKSRSKGQKRNSNAGTPQSKKPTLPSADGLSDKQYVMQLIQKLGKSVGAGEQEYYFPDPDGKVTKILVTSNQKKALTSGALAVAYPQHRREQFVLVADYVAEEIAKRIATRIASWHAEKWPELKAAYQQKLVLEESSDAEPQVSSNVDAVETQAAG